MKRLPKGLARRVAGHLVQFTGGMVQEMEWS